MGNIEDHVRTILESVIDEDGMMDKGKVKNLSDPEKLQIIFYLVKEDWMILEEFIPDIYDMRFLYKKGYVRQLTNGSGYRYICTEKQYPKWKAWENTPLTNKTE